eukprot:GSMAST32.ASY1.ANO1.2537.1 assembled CDS
MPPPILDTRSSPDGNFIAYVQGGEIYVPIRCMSSDGIKDRIKETVKTVKRSVVTHGVSSFIAQEEMGRFRGFWWSDDSTMIAFEEVDYEPVSEHKILHLDKTDVPLEENHYYPFAGKKNVKSRLGVVAVNNPEIDEKKSCARVQWMSDTFLLVQTQSRRQDKTELLQINSVTGKCVKLLEESDRNIGWVNLHQLCSVVTTQNTSNDKTNDKKWLIWGSERSGYMHLYLYAFDNKKKQKTTRKTKDQNNFFEKICGIDTVRGILFFTGTKESVLENHLYATQIPFKNKRYHEKITRLTPKESFNTITMSHNCKYFINCSSSLQSAPSVQLFAIKVTPTINLQACTNNSGFSSLRPPLLISFPSTDGAVTLHGMIYVPDSTIFGNGPYPTIVNVYGGPLVQAVKRSWNVSMDVLSRHFQGLGFSVLKCDNRGSSRRGVEFERAIYLGSVEVEDQVAAVKYAISLGIVDRDKVGCYGWSFGGFLSTMCLLKAPDIFKAAVAGAPVTNWTGYDTHYTERYMYVFVNFFFFF